MADDLFDDLLQLEDEFYTEGFDAGVADSEYAGMIEGKVFGIEKGYEKALQLAKLHGRALVWQRRWQSRASPGSPQSNVESTTPLLQSVQQNSGPIPRNTRLEKHIEALLALTTASTLSTENSDDAVSDFDERLAKANAKAKVIANIIGESLNPATVSNAGIEDATGLNARH